MVKHTLKILRCEDHLRPCQTSMLNYKLTYLEVYKHAPKTKKGNGLLIILFKKRIFRLHLIYMMER